MKISITKKEYRLLLDVFFIAEWVMNSHKVEDDPKSEPYERLEQKFMSYAKDFGFENLIVFNKKAEKYFPTGEYEESGDARSFIDEFEDEVFWEELCKRLALRDLIEEKGIQKVKEMEIIERLTEEDKIAERYNNEFIKNGLKYLSISKK